jgi:hypothetical protein
MGEPSRVCAPDRLRPTAPVGRRSPHSRHTVFQVNYKISESIGKGRSGRKAPRVTLASMPVEHPRRMKNVNVPKPDLIIDDTPGMCLSPIVCNVHEEESWPAMAERIVGRYVM